MALGKQRTHLPTFMLFSSCIRAQLPDHVMEYFSRITPNSNDSGVQSGSSRGHEPTPVKCTDTKSNNEPEASAEKLLNDYEDSLKLNFGHRLSILQGNLSDYLNVEYSFDKVAKSIHREKRKNADYSYWSAKLLQVRQAILTFFQTVLEKSWR